MPLKFTAQVDKKDVRRINARFRKMSDQVRDWRPFWPAAQAVLHQSVMANFRSGGRPRKWRKLSPWTLRVRRERGALGSTALSQNVLMDSGALFQSIGNVNEQQRDSFRYGTNMMYARLMNYGTAGLPGGVLKPKRSQHFALPFPGVMGRPRDYTNTFVLTTARSKSIWQKATGDSAARPLFLLKKSVAIPARPFMMFQKKDVDRLLRMAKVYIFDPKRFATGGG